MHMYVETGRSTSSSATKLNFVLAATTAFTWLVKISMIECTSVMRPPTDCVQWYTGRSGTVENYNYNAGSGQVLAAQNYATCVRSERGYCAIQWSGTRVTTPLAASPTIDDFDIHTPVIISEHRTTSCSNAYLAFMSVPPIRYATQEIGVPNWETSGTFCGGVFSPQSIGSANVALGPIFPGSVTQHATPFKFNFRTANAGNDPGGDGYQLQWEQVGCSGGSQGSG